MPALDVCAGSHAPTKGPRPPGGRSSVANALWEGVHTVRLSRIVRFSRRDLLQPVCTFAQVQEGFSAKQDMADAQERVPPISGA